MLLEQLIFRNLCVRYSGTIAEPAEFSPNEVFSVVFLFQVSEYTTDFLPGKLLCEVWSFNPINFKTGIGLFYGNNKFLEAERTLVLFVNRDNVSGSLCWPTWFRARIIGIPFVEETGLNIVLGKIKMYDEKWIAGSADRFLDCLVQNKNTESCR